MNTKKVLTAAFLSLVAIGSLSQPITVAKADVENPLFEAVATMKQGTYSVLPMRVTAYTSDVSETDDTPFITANGTYVRDGIIASNMLPFGTKVKIPALFGDKIFTVTDRMSPKFYRTIDIWMPEKTKALRFGVTYANVVILGTSTYSAHLFETKDLSYLK